jgi:hypothetical protein
VPNGAVPPALPPAVSSLLPPAVQPLPVQTPGAQIIHVLGAEEQGYYNSQSAKYQQEFAFTNVSDLADLDQLLFLETQMYRFSRWLGTGKDYDGIDVDINATRRALKETADLVGKVKSGLGMTKSQRDKETESVSSYIVTLKQRAKEFGVHREKQLGRSLELINELFSIVGSFDRADQIEREKLGYPDEQAILDWIRTYMRPKYDEVDAYFRQHQQRNWLKDI